MFRTVLILIGLLATSYAFQFPPPPITRCRPSDESCLIKQTQTFLVDYKDGIPEIDIKPLDPIDIDDFEIKSNGNANSPTALNLAITDMKLLNLAGTIVQNAKVLAADPTKPVKVQVKLFSPHTTLKSHYKIDGKILILPIKGEGEAVIKTTNSTSKINVILKFEKRDDGKFYLKDADVQFIQKSDNVNIHLSNLFNGEKELAENILKVMNDNWKLLVADVDPAINRSMAKRVAQDFKVMLKDVPFDEIFLKE